MKNIIQSFLLIGSLFLIAACQTTQQDIQSARLAMNEQIQNEPPGNYFIGRRYFKQDYKFWGYIRKPGQSWKTATMVMLNEQKKLAPDREKNLIGSDNNYEYKLYGRFSGDTVYEPASNGFYPEFVLTGYDLVSIRPAPIYSVLGATDPSVRVIANPY